MRGEAPTPNLKGNERKTTMEIGEPQRVVIVEPLELPEPLRPAAEPQRVEQPEKVEEPV